LLDIGCGSGGFLRALSLGGAWRGVGMDIHPAALDIARSQGVRVWCGEASAVGLPSASFEVVTMWEVIEHVPAPRQALSEVRRVLKPGGSLLLGTPNSAGWQARCWGEHWIGWDVPRHLQVFSFQTLRRALEEAGFVVVRRLSFPGERFYAVESARRWAQGHGNCVTGFVGQVARAAGWATWPALRLADATPWASCIALEARAV
jgi:ubiquinone/menaquinone biosynthesis C-methylase UbiE